MFNRGETQALVISTLGTSRDTQDIDGLTGGAKSKSFILHYNFPPFSTGEAGRFGFTGRREIGHGALAERSLLPILPPEDEFPYAIRVVSEVMSSNGSTSMASICGGCLSLMDAGVPVTAPCAGNLTGLVTEKDENGKITKSVLLTDILGAEDHFGDMDFKIAGTPDGITGFQLDLKITGLPFNIALEAIKQNRDARMKILAIMSEHMPESRKDLREHAPRVHTISIAPDKIGALIGPGGKNIPSYHRSVWRAGRYQRRRQSPHLRHRQRIHESRDLGSRCMHSRDRSWQDLSRRHRSRRERLRCIRRECLPGKEGLVHISELADFRVNQTEDICKLGDEMVVKCIGVEKGKVRLSRKAALEEAKEESEEDSTVEETTAIE